MDMVKKDITPHLYQKLCIEILLNVLHNTSVTVLLAWQHTRLQTPSLVATFGVPF